MGAFAADITKLIARLEKADMAYELHHVLAALRGPDSECFGCKIATAQIRKAVLSERGYHAAGYTPEYNSVPAGLPETNQVKLVNNLNKHAEDYPDHMTKLHFVNHIRFA